MMPSDPNITAALLTAATADPHGPMMPDEMRECLETLGWGQRELARQINSHESSVRQMARGKREIPETLAVWLRTIAAVHRALPQPIGWNGRKRRDENQKD